MSSRSLSNERLADGPKAARCRRVVLSDRQRSIPFRNGDARLSCASNASSYVEGKAKMVWKRGWRITQGGRGERERRR